MDLLLQVVYNPSWSLRSITILIYYFMRAAANLSPIYLDLDLESVRKQLPSKSYFEACAILWHLGDYFCLESVRSKALRHLEQHRSVLTEEAGHICEFLEKGVPYIHELEAGIRAAWKPGRFFEPVQRQLVQLCCTLTKYFHHHESFADLLNEVSDFNADFTRALLGYTNSKTPTKVTAPSVWNEEDQACEVRDRP